MGALDPDWVGGQRARLLEQLAELEALRAAGADAAAAVELDQSKVGRLTRMDAMQQQAMSLATQRRRAAQIAAIRRALARIAANDYGLCLDCDEAIAPARLEFDPAAERCIACAEQADVG
ncbi:MAG: TraR/DksA C4-type zinc finger protein [Pseudomonadota bacterium]